MSREIGSLLERLLKNSVIGAAIALVSYVTLQLLCALMVHCEIAGEGMIYLMVCVSAAVSSFLGCVYSVMRGGDGYILSASAVAVVFLSLTVVIGLLSCESGSIGAGLAGVGGAMAAGGLLAAAVPALMKRGDSTKGRGKRNRRR